MAFAFSKINQALGVDDNPQKQDIFGQQGTQAGTVDGAQPQGGGTAAVKTSTAGDLDGGGSSGEAPPGQAATASLDQTQSAGRAALRANMGKTATPKLLSDVGNTIKSRQDALQAEADTYTSGQKAKQTYGVGNEDLEKAIGGDADTAGKVRNLFGQTTVKPIDGFAPTTDVEVEDTQRLKSDRGLQELLARGQGPTYNQGESAFDLRSLRKTAGFDQQLKDIEGKQEAVRQAKRDISGTSQKAVEDYGKEQLTAAQKAAQGYLTGKGDELEASNAKQASEAQAALDQIKAQGRGATSGDVKAVIRDLQKRYGETDPRVVRFIEQAAGVNLGGESVVNLKDAKIDPTQFQKFRANPYQAADFYDEGEAGRFNSIMGLLGKGDARVAGAGADPNAYSFDRAGYESALDASTRGLRGAQDELNEKDIAGILGGAQSRADQADAGWLNADNAAAARQQALAARGAEASNFFDPTLYETYRVKDAQGQLGVDPMSFYKGDTRDLDARKVLTADEAGRLNTLAKDTGKEANYAAGTETTQSQASFDKQSYLNALRAYLEQNKAVTPETPAEGDKGTDPRPVEAEVADKLKNGIQDAVKAPAGDLQKRVEGAAKGADIPGIKPLVDANTNNGEGKQPMSIGATVQKGIDKVSAAANKTGVPAQVVKTLGNAATGPSKLNAKDILTKVTSDPGGSLKDIISKGGKSPFGDPRSTPGFWDTVVKSGYDKQVVDNMITMAMSGKGPKNIDGALAQAKSIGTKALGALPKGPPPAVSPVIVGGPGVGYGPVGTSFDQINSQLAAAKNKAEVVAGDLARYGKEKAGSAVATGKKIFGG